MILGFSQHYPFDKERPTDFIEKIGKGIKIHSLREDKNGRWRKGVKIQMSIGVRSKNYFCFNETECKNTQRVLIMYDEKRNSIFISIDRKKLSRAQIEIFIANDGFDNRQDFINWFFPLDGRGKRKATMTSKKLIHFTDFKY